MPQSFRPEMPQGPAGGTWVPPALRTPHWKIFNEQFMCRVSYINSLSVEEIEFFGMPNSGSKRYDQEAANEMVLRMLTINKMTEYYRKGIPVLLDRSVDPKVIYDIIDDHLKIWKNKLERSLNRSAAPVDDLILLDAFANTIYEKGQLQFTTEIVDSILMKQMSAVLKHSRETILNRPKNLRTNTIGPDMPVNATPEPVEENKRPSMASTFAEYQRFHTGKPGWK